MRPYYIVTPSYSAWVDLDQVQVITDIIDQIAELTYLYGGIPCMAFQVTLVFQNEPLQVGLYPELKNSEWEVVSAENVDAFKLAHAGLLAAWKNEPSGSK